MKEFFEKKSIKMTNFQATYNTENTNYQLLGMKQEIYHYRSCRHQKLSNKGKQTTLHAEIVQLKMKLTNSFKDKNYQNSHKVKYTT